MMEWERKLDIRAPLEQAERCLGQWLKEEKRSLSRAERRRAAALMARYFYHEDEMTDQLMLSFLRHYSNGPAPDMEDPASVRMEIKSVLDTAEVRGFMPAARRVMMLAGFAVLFAGIYGWNIARRPISFTEQMDLKKLVHDAAVQGRYGTTAAVWRAVKKPWHLGRYEEMDQWQYWQSRRMLTQRLREK